MENEGITTHCPMCGGKVTKVRETDRTPKGEPICENEYYIHVGDVLVKFRNARHNYY